MPEQEPRPADHHHENTNSENEHETAEAQARRKVWEPRYKQFTAEWTTQTLRGVDDPSTGIVPILTRSGPHYDWMTPENLPDYVLFRLDMIDRAGGTEHYRLHRETTDFLASEGLDASFLSHPLFKPVSSLNSEIISWGGEAAEDFTQVLHGLFSGTRKHAADLSPRQADLLTTLKARADRIQRHPGSRPPGHDEPGAAPPPTRRRGQGRQSPGTGST
jgi:hypothetical protein